MGRMKLMISTLPCFLNVCFGVKVFSIGDSELSFNNICGKTSAGSVGRTMLILDFFRVSWNNQKQFRYSSYTHTVHILFFFSFFFFFFFFSTCDGNSLRYVCHSPYSSKTISSKSIVTAVRGEMFSKSSKNITTWHWCQSLYYLSPGLDCWFWTRNCLPTKFPCIRLSKTKYNLS